MVLEVPFSASVRLNCFFYVFIYGCSKLCTALKKFFSFETERQKAAGAGKTPAATTASILESFLNIAFILQRNIRKVWSS